LDLDMNIDLYMVTDMDKNKDTKKEMVYLFWSDSMRLKQNCLRLALFQSEYSEVYTCSLFD
jgi:hypothetical protein